MRPSTWVFAGIAARTVFTAMRFQSVAVAADPPDACALDDAAPAATARTRARATSPDSLRATALGDFISNPLPWSVQPAAPQRKARLTSLFPAGGRVDTSYGVGCGNAHVGTERCERPSLAGCRDRRSRRRPAVSSRASRSPRGLVRRRRGLVLRTRPSTTAGGLRRELRVRRDRCARRRRRNTRVLPAGP